jgi:YD repeat-containing protein
VLSGVSYRPFGPAQGFTFGNNQTYTRGFDQDGRVASYTLGTQSFALGYDAASRIGFVSDIGSPANSNTYSYDNLDRLTNAVLPGTPFAYAYDAVGNRLSKTVGASTDTYTPAAASNRLASIAPGTGPLKNYVHDATGAVTADGTNTYAYDTRGRLIQAVSVIGTTSYQVNSLGQRIRKTNTQGDTVYHCDAQGRLIAETSISGTLQKEYIYLGDIPVAAIQ